MAISEELKNEVSELMSRHGVAAALGWSKIHTLLQRAKLSLQKKVIPEEIGAHPCNRSGLLADVSKSHDIGGAIIDQGFVLSKTQLATAFVMPKSTKAARHATDLNAWRFALQRRISSCKHGSRFSARGYRGTLDCS